MNCAELRDYYELYAMGVAAEPERTEIREHMERNCEVCVAEMKRARQIVALLGGSARPAATPLRNCGGESSHPSALSSGALDWAPFLAVSGREAPECTFAAILFQQPGNAATQMKWPSCAIRCASRPSNSRNSTRR